MDVLELREELSAAQAALDMAKVEVVAKQVAARHANVERELVLAFEQLAAERSPDPSELSRIACKLGELRYFRRLLAEAQTIEDEIA
jgi:hypothetical protein